MMSFVQRVCYKIWSLLLAGCLVAGAAAESPSGSPPAVDGSRESILQFVNGDRLRGDLAGITAEAGIIWQSPAADQPLRFAPSAIASLSLAGSGARPPATPSAVVELINDDSLRGELLGLDANGLSLKTSYAGTVTVPRSMLRRVETPPKRVVFEGLISLADWQRSPPATLTKSCTVCHSQPTIADWKRSPAKLEPWLLDREVLTVRGQGGVLGREMRLPDQARIDFDLDWGKAPSLSVGVYARDARTNSAFSDDKAYWVVIEPGAARLLQSSPTFDREVQGLPKGASRVAVPRFAEPGRARVTILTDKVKRTITLALDGQTVKTWRLPAWSANGTAFALSGLGSCIRSQMKLTNLRVQSVGIELPEKIEHATTEDQVVFANADQAGGSLSSIAGDQLNFSSKDNGQLAVPLERVTEIRFAAERAERARRSPGDARIRLVDGSQLTLAVRSLDGQALTGTAQYATEFRLPLNAIREVWFQTDETRPAEGDRLIGTTGPPANALPTTGALRFRNGDRLSGELVGVSPGKSLAWRHPAAPAPFQFRAGTVDRIVLGGAPVAAPENAAVEMHLANGDRLRGELASLEENKVVLVTATAGTLTIPRAMLRRLVSLNVQGAVLFGNPQTIADWKTPPPVTLNNACVRCHPGGWKTPPRLDRWQFTNGVFTANGPAGGAIGRDMNLPDRARIEFDLAWEKTPEARIGLYARNLTGEHPRQTADITCWIQLSDGGVNWVWYRKDGNQANAIEAGEFVAIPGWAARKKARIAILTDKPRRVIALRVDGELLYTWTMPADWAPNGTGLVLSKYGTCLRGKWQLSNLRIERHFEVLGGTEVIVAPRSSDTVNFADGTQATGKVKSVSGGKLTYAPNGGPTEAPMGGVAEILFAGEPLKAGVRPETDVRVLLHDGSEVTLDLDQIDAESLTGKAADIGQVRIARRWVSELRLSSSEKSEP